MANPRMDVTAFVSKLLKEDDAEMLREGVRVAQIVMETEVSAQSGDPTSGGPENRRWQLVPLHGCCQ